MRSSSQRSMLVLAAGLFLVSTAVVPARAEESEESKTVVSVATSTGIKSKSTDRTDGPRSITLGSRRNESRVDQPPESQNVSASR